MHGKQTVNAGESKMGFGLHFLFLVDLTLLTPFEQQQTTPPYEQYQYHNATCLTRPTFLDTAYASDLRTISFHANMSSKTAHPCHHQILLRESRDRSLQDQTPGNSELALWPVRARPLGLNNNPLPHPRHHPMLTQGSSDRSVPNHAPENSQPIL